MLEVITPGNPLGFLLIAAGVGMLLTGIGTLLSGNNLGIISSSRNPIEPWRVVYGRSRVGGTVIYINEFGAQDKWLDMVLVLAGHACGGASTIFYSIRSAFRSAREQYQLHASSAGDRTSRASPA